MAVVAFDLFHSIIVSDDGSMFVSVEVNRGENHQTTRAAARRYVAQELGPLWSLGSFVSLDHYRRRDGHPAVARVYVVNFTGR